MVVCRWEEFVVSGQDPKITLSYKPVGPAGSQLVFVYWNDLNGFTEKIPCCQYGCSVLLTGNFGDESSVIAYYECDNQNAREVTMLASDYGKMDRCPYCNCKIDSTKTHCASCGAPC